MIYFLNLTVFIFLNIIGYLKAETCQTFSRQHVPRFFEGYLASNFLKLPNTNILLVNTIQYQNQAESSSIVYYNDISSSIDNILNVVKPDYVIVQMEYFQERNEILVINSQQLIYADPYTLKSKLKLSFSTIKRMHFIKGSSYCLIQGEVQMLYIIDVVAAKQVFSLNISPYNSDPTNYIKTAKLFQLQNGQVFIAAIDGYGAYTWSINFQTLNFTFNGYLKDQSYGYTNYLLVDLHQSYDILFLAGQYSEISAFQIIDLQMNQIKLIQTQYLPDDYFEYVFYSLNFVNSLSNQGSLYLSSQYYIYRIDLNIIYNNNTKVFDAFSFNNIDDPFVLASPGKQFIEWYHLEQSQQFLIPYYNGYFSLTSLFVYSYRTNTQLTRFTYATAGFTNIYSFQLNQNIYFAVANFNNIQVTLDSPSNLQSAQSFPLSQTIKARQNTFFAVKNCVTCFVLMHDNTCLGAYKVMDLSFTPQLYDLSQLNLNIDSISFNIDPYYDSNNNFWVIVGLPFKQNNEKLLFYAINISSQKLFNLVSNKEEENNQTTSYALISYEDQEIIGISVNGIIFVWSFTDFSFKYSITESNCPGSIIGQLMHIDDNKLLIMVCGDYNLISYNFAKNNFQHLQKLQSNPYCLNVFKNIKMFGVGDYYSNTFLWIYNELTSQFELFMQFQSPSYTDLVSNIQYIEKTQVLLIQFYYSNTFFHFGQCLKNVDSCKSKCQMSFYFNTTETIDSYGNCGKGSVDQPYTSSLSIIPSLLLVQQYFELINGFELLNVFLLLNSQNQITFYNELFSLQSLAKTVLTIQSLNKNQLAQININQKIQLSGLYMLSVSDILFQFVISVSQQTQYNCGLYFDSIIQSAVIDNIRISSTTNTSVCFFFNINNSLLTIKNINLKGLDFSNSSALISVVNSDQITLQNILLDNCTLNEQFSIITQQSDVYAILDTLIIQNNICDINKIYYPQFAGKLFKAGQFYVANMIISNNQFCNQQIFSTVSTIEQQNYTFQFQNVSLYHNSFYTNQNYLFFDALYSINPLPQHKLIMSYLNFSDNSYFPSSQVQSDIYLGITQLVLTEKIFLVQITDVIVKNQQEIAFCQISQSSQVELSSISCLNEKSFFNSLVNREYGGCLLFNEIKQISITNLQSSNINGINNSILTIINQVYTNSIINVFKAKIIDSYFEQSQTISQANPILISSTYNSNITISNSTFSQNKLYAIPNTQTYSTSAIQIINPLGLNITIINSNCKQSSFNITDNITTFVQQGGCLRAKSNNIQILSSNFSQSTASKGAFIYFESLSFEINILIEKSMFEEGYAQQDGSAFYINSQNSNLNLMCKESNFNNIYSLRSYSSSISIEQSQNQIKLNSIQFQQGELLNILGKANSYFLNIQNSNVTLFNIQKIIFDQTYPEYLNQMIKISDIQSVSYFQLQESMLQIIDCGFYNLLIKNQQHLLPLLINSTNSNILLQRSLITNSTFSTTLMSVNQGFFSIEGSKFININQIPQKRVLQSQNSLVQSGALISLFQSKLQIQQQTIFQKIICLECLGSILQMNYTQFFISDSFFLESKAKNGGAISINGLISNQNQILNTQLIANTATLNGGAIYLKAQNDDVFTLTLSGCLINDNQSLNGSGGGFFINSGSESTVQQQIQINKTNLTNNKAIIGGCINNQGINPLIDSQSTLQNNQATLYGDTICSYPDHLSLVMTADMNKYFNQSTNSLVLSNIKSGAQIPDIIFQLRDQTIKPIFPFDADKIQIQVQFSSKTQNISNYYIRGNSTSFVDLELKQFIFNGIQLIGIPNSYAIIEFKSDAIKILNKSTNQFESNYSYELLVYFRSCNYGEIENSYNTYTECVVCDVDKYSLDNKQCYPCPDGAMCKNGIIYVNQGFWRKNESSPLVIECANRPQNCIGNKYGNQVCLKGYIGPLCEECDLYGSYWGESYSKIGSYQCGKCSELSYYLWKAILAVILTLLSIQIAIREDLKENVTENHQKLNSESIQFQKDIETIFSNQGNQTPMSPAILQLDKVIIAMDKQQTQADQLDTQNCKQKLNSVNEEDQNDNLIHFTLDELDKTSNL
ncbi:hypothetical protein ABPG74_016210 [Tetrahymena malaccensis]